MTGWQLAQINIGRLVAPEGDPLVQPFFDALERVNAIAEASPGFVWRLADDGGLSATGIQATSDPLLLINENRLSLADPRARAYLAEQVQKHFFGEGADVAQGYVPPQS